jgi:hypothetical protein
VRRSTIPDSALAAALEAVCIARRLKQEAAKKGNTAAIDRELANFQDTLDYVLLQTKTKQLSEAASKAMDFLQEAMRVSNDDDDRQVMFHYSIAQYASSDDRDEAMRTLKTSMTKKRYVSEP